MKFGLWMLAVSFAFAQTPADPTFFSARLYPVLEGAQCRGCHVEDGVASGTRLRFPEPSANPARLQAFGVSLGILVDRTDPAKSLLLNKPTNRISHTGGERIKPDSEESQILLEWVRHLASLSPAAIADAAKTLAATAPAARPEQFVRRLTHSQYNNTVRDLLGDYSKPADSFPAEDYIDGFKNQLSTQGMPPLLVESYSATAEKMALNAFRAGDVNGLLPCKPVSAADVKCRDQFVRTFGGRAFRRPLTDLEFRRYTTLFSAQARKPGKADSPPASPAPAAKAAPLPAASTSTSQFLEGARVVVEAMLQSPKFLFHVESAGGKYPDHEIASRLSYFLWNTAPDRSVLTAVPTGELRTAQGREKVARGMLADPRAREAVDEFFSQWMRYEHVLGASKDRRRFPEFTPDLAAMMVEETRRLLAHLVWENRNFMEAFTADYGFLNTELAAFYKFPNPGNEFQLVKFPADTRRVGLLGHAGFLAATAGPVETSPTMRGIFVREQLLCQHIPNPPAGVNTNLPEPTADKPQTRRQRLAAHQQNASCAACHKLMDPIGFGLENFDGIGKWRDQERIEITGETPGAGMKRIDLPLDTKGEVAGIANSAFSDPRQLGAALAASPVCQECVVRQVFRYAYGRMETPADKETVRQLFVAFRDSGFHFQDLLLAVVRAPQFKEGMNP